MPKVSFAPAQNGFHFANRFVNPIVRLPIYGEITTYGRCGGMSYAALDCHFTRTPVPAQTEADYAGTGGIPADGTPLADYIFHRQIDSFLVPSAVKFITWSVTPDAPTVFVRGVTQWTKIDEFNKLRAAIDAGNPVPLGLIVATDLSGLAHNHQVVAYGYEGDGDSITVLIYDNNHPDQEVTLRSNSNTPQFQESTGESWRGFFVQDYRPQQPPSAIGAGGMALQPIDKGIAAVAAPRRPGRAKHIAVTIDRIVLNDSNDNQGVHPFALLVEVNQQRLRWPAKGARQVRAGRGYVINRSLDILLRDDGELAFTAKAVNPDFDAVALADNDLPVTDLAIRYDAATKWGRGRHTGTWGSSEHGFSIEYTIK